jgi:glutamate-5-semialdehyde dehydrogenase
VARLALDRGKIARMAQGVREVAALEDPLGRVLEKTTRPNGLVIEKRSVPLGVLLIIYESRPNVTSDCAALAVKSGNAVILKGGSEALRTNRALHAAFAAALKDEGVPEAAVALVASKDRSDVQALLRLDGLIDVCIPRGGESLIRKVAQISKIPVIKHYKGVCHVYVDRSADLDMAQKIAENAKVQNPSVCNAMETLLVHRDVARQFLIPFGESMRKKGVELRGCPETRRILKGAKRATETDWEAEYLDLILAVRVVGNLDEAVRHIERYGSAHSDAIVSRDPQALAEFTNRLDSACVFANASTRFSDGGEFGMGAEIGISTDKLHARGPMGLRELTTYKYVVFGNGQIRA